MTDDHDDQEGNIFPFPVSLPGFELTQGVVEVHELGGSQVDRPDIAAEGLNAMTKAVDSAGGKIIGPVAFKRPKDGLTDDAILEALDFPADPDDHLLD